MNCYCCGRPGESQTLVVSHEELCGCVLDDCEFKEGWRAALRAVSKWGAAYVPSVAQVDAFVKAINDNGFVLDRGAVLSGLIAVEKIRDSA